MRRTIFLSDDGIVLCATLRALDEIGILEPSLTTAGASLHDLYPDITPSGFGYLRTGLRSMASQGWLSYEPALEPGAAYLDWTEPGRRAAAYSRRYVALGDFLAGFSSNAADAWALPWEDAQGESFVELLKPCLGRWELADELPRELATTIASHLDAALVVPALLSLLGTGRLGGEAPALPDDEIGRGIGRLLRMLGWLSTDGRWSAEGRQARDYAVHFGIVGSYFPMLARLPELYRGELSVATSASAEWHVNRELNVLASAAAHKRYFSDADEIFLELFDREPVAMQPRFIADMGCGDGSWLVHLHRLISERTLRGRHLDDHPLQMVGVDFNAAALERAASELQLADVPGLVVFGDVSDPDSLRSTLAEHGLAIEEGLHIRSFLDHDRTYLGAAPDIPVEGRSTGTYVDRLGHPLDAAAVEGDLIAHLRRWTPHVRTHGLVVLEAHCVAPSVARRHLGSLHSVAFDAYHAYSHQYLVEYSSFIDCCQQAGLERLGHRERHYPSSRPFVAVSLNRLQVPEAEARLPAPTTCDSREDGWRPRPEVDPEDGEALHRLLYSGGDLRHPRTWCAAATGYVVDGALGAVESRLESAERGDVIRVLDYGTGTGLAAIELLKALREREIEQRLEERGAALELHLVDLPSDWLAQGYRLLSGCAWTRFHSLRGADGGFRSLWDVLGGRVMDVAIASMVFHLIPPTALERVATELSGVLAPHGRLLWNSPDLGPAGPYAVLFHDANRMLRARWLERDGSRLDPATRRAAQERADRRILPRAQTADDVVRVLSRHLVGDVELRTYEMVDQEILDALLVPSNQGEYLSEIPDRAERERTIRELMLEDVLPTMRESAAGTALGLNVQWTFGDFGRISAPSSRRR